MCFIWGADRKNVNFSGFAGNLYAQKLNKPQPNRANITGLYSIIACINRWCKLCIYPLSSLHFTSSLFSQTSLFATTRVSPPLAWAGIRNSRTPSYLTSDYPLATTDTLLLPPRFWRRICCCSYCRLQRRPPSTLNLIIWRRCHRQWRTPIKAYPVSSLLI